jgi:hypothetical protein
MALPTISGGKIATLSNEYGTLIAKGNNALASAAPGVQEILSPKASEIFEKRTATRIFNSSQDVALENIEGGIEPTFNENQNLYGFTIFQYKSGMLGGGWAPINVTTLLGFDLSGLSAQMLGGDQLANVNSYFFNLHPKAMSLTEPFATQLIPTQGGGVYAESQGTIFRNLSMTGTTGYRPKYVHTPTLSADKTIPWEANEPTGFLNFLKLRNLFRNYSDLKKDKSQAYKTYMVWFNNKEQEAWFFEPTAFSTERSAASPFTYNYTINGTLLQKVNFSTVVNKINPDQNTPHFWVASLRKSAGMMNGLFGQLFPSFGDNVIGDALAATGNFLSLLDDLDRTVTNLIETGAGIVGTVPVMAASVHAAGQAMSSAFNAASKKYSTIFGTSIASVDVLGKMITFDKAYRDAIQATISLSSPESTATLQAGLSSSGLEINSVQNKDNIVWKNDNFLQEDTAWSPYSITDFDQTLEDLVLLVLGDTSALQAIISYNNLDYPYLSSTPTYQKGINKLLTPGDSIYLPFPTDLTSGDLNIKINPNKLKQDVYDELLGRDIKLIKTTQGTTGVSQFNLALSPTGDLDVTAGKDNMMQAIDIKLNTERGELTPHPEFGIISVIGNKGTRNLNFNLHLSLNDTMLSDGRIKELTNTYVRISGDVVSVRTNVNIIGKSSHIPLTFDMAV